MYTQTCLTVTLTILGSSRCHLYIGRVSAGSLVHQDPRAVLLVLRHIFELQSYVLSTQYNVRSYYVL